jgi:protein O-GlcNAc transferase
MRGGLRQRMSRSRLMDAVAFTRGLEAAYRRAWAKWCESAGPAA